MRYTHEHTKKETQTPTNTDFLQTINNDHNTRNGVAGSRWNANDIESRRIQSYNKSTYESE